MNCERQVITSLQFVSLAFLLDHASNIGKTWIAKHNPIEHRTFPHVTRACKGVVFQSVPLVKQWIERTPVRVKDHCGIATFTVDILDRGH